MGGSVSYFHDSCSIKKLIQLSSHIWDLFYQKITRCLLFTSNLMFFIPFLNQVNFFRVKAEFSCIVRIYIDFSLIFVLFHQILLDPIHISYLTPYNYMGWKNKCWYIWRNKDWTKWPWVQNFHLRYLQKRENGSISAKAFVKFCMSLSPNLSFHLESCRTSNQI